MKKGTEVIILRGVFKGTKAIVANEANQRGYLRLKMNNGYMTIQPLDNVQREEDYFSQKDRFEGKYGSIFEKEAPRDPTEY